MSTARILITGSRAFVNRAMVWDALYVELTLRQAYETVVLVHGGCPTGADETASECWKYWRRPVEGHPVTDGERAMFGKRAYYLRNKRMVDLGASVCLAFFQAGEGNVGTQMTVNLAKAARIPVKEAWSDGRHFPAEIRSGSSTGGARA